MNKEQIKEALLGKPDCRKEETPLCQFSTFHPDMEMVEILLKGADIQKSFNHQPLGWVLQFCEPNWDRMLELLFKYKYYGLHLDRKTDFGNLLRMLARVKSETILFVLKTMRKHNFALSSSQDIMIRREDFRRVFAFYKDVFGL